ncbi:hypothetical protein DOT_3213 [Desulfosporosinus sp. OT]|nr:hypothetical protein DOT_3213 [Desulfosporosinus sp. OT]
MSCCGIRKKTSSRNYSCTCSYGYFGLVYVPCKERLLSSS